MATLVIEGQHPLNGDVTVSGMKNAATPVIAATLLTQEECVIDNVPRILDVFKMLELLKSLGAQYAWTGQHTLTIQCKDIDPTRLDQSSVQALRSSVLLLGPLLARFPELALQHPGGCIIGNRPLDAHFEVLRGLGVRVTEERDILHMQRDYLRPGTVVLSEFSVTATENFLMAATSVQGAAVLHTAAAEPHVQDLARFLQAMGARIQGAGAHTLTVDGGNALHGAHHTLIPDQIEVGTWAAAAGVTRGIITVRGVAPEHLHLIVLKLAQAGVRCTLRGTDLIVSGKHRLRAFRLQTLPYPGFPSDVQAPFGVLATQAQGTSLIQETLYEGRLGYIQELVKMGANAVICDPHRVLITGPTPLYGQELRSFDLRAGATLILAGLIARGTTTIHGAELVDRGYEDIDGRLRSLGARIERHADH